MTTGPGSVAILGLGLMGGSLARALRAVREPPRLTAWTPAGGEPARALAEGVIDAAAPTLADAVSRARVVVLAAPVGASIALLPEIARVAPSDAVITDVCSVKAPLGAAAGAAGIADRFVGAHPMCGSHDAGWDASRVDLFDGATVWIVPAGAEAATRRVEALWSALDAVPERTTAAMHDRLMAHASHVPQILASALGRALAQAGVSRVRLGPGGSDMTRLAASPPDLWADLLLHNRDALLDAIPRIVAEMRTFEHALEADDAQALRAALEDGRKWATESA